MQIQKDILLFFSNFSNPVLVSFFEFFSMFGEELLPTAIGLLIFWCLDKKKGFLSLSILLTSNLAMHILKATIRFPRPWKVIPELNSQRISTATGYSFPSGHSSTAGAFYSTVAMTYRKKWLSVACAFIMFVVPLSRLFLCVHWPMDVACGLLLGFFVAYKLIRVFGKMFDQIEKYSKPLIVCGIVMFAIALIVAVLIQFSLADKDAFSDMTKCLAMLAGTVIFYPVEEKYLCFSVEGSFTVKLIRYAVGLAGALFFMVGVKYILPYTPIVTVFRYLSVSTWCCLYPFIGKKMRLFR